MDQKYQWAGRFIETVHDLLWVVPTFQTIHILCVGIVFSASVIVALGRWALPARTGRSRAGSSASPWTLVSLAVLLFSGAVLTLAEPEREAAERPLPDQDAARCGDDAAELRHRPAFFVHSRRSAGLVRSQVSGPSSFFLLWGVIMCLGRWSCLMPADVKGFLAVVTIDTVLQSIAEMPIAVRIAEDPGVFPVDRGDPCTGNHRRLRFDPCWSTWRLMGLAARDYPIVRLSKAIVPLTWVAFLIAATSGAALFISNPITYFGNTRLPREDAADDLRGPQYGDFPSVDLARRCALGREPTCPARRAVRWLDLGTALGEHHHLRSVDRFHDGAILAGAENTL